MCFEIFEGDRGANKITYCLLNDFQRRGFSSLNYGDLTLIADICGGQNKNKYAVRFLISLVETKLFLKITLLFSVK